MVRKMAYVGFSYLAGMLFASFFSFYALMCVMTLVFIVCAVFYFAKVRHSSGKRRETFDAAILTMLVCAVSASVGIILYSSYDKNVYENVVSYDGKEISFTGEITDLRQYDSGFSLYTAKGEIEGNTKAAVTFFSENDICEISDRICVIGKCEALNDSWKFPEKSYYKSKGIFVKIAEISSLEVQKNNSFTIVSALKDYRDRICTEIRNFLPGQEGAVMLAMLFGDKSELDDSDKICFYRSGIGHIMAVSGAHMVIISGFAMGLLSGLHLGRIEKLILLAFVVLPFAVMVGFTPSVVRSVIMIFIVYSADVFKRQGDTMNSLGIAAIALTLNNPFCVRDPSFLMSFAGVIGIGVIAPAILDAVKTVYKKPDDFTSALVTSFGATLAVYPISVFFFDEMSVVSPLIQILLMPLCTLILFCGAAVLVTGGAVYPLLFIGGSAAHIVLNVCRFFGERPWSYIPLSGKVPKIGVVVIALLAVSAGLLRGRKRCAWAASMGFILMIAAASVERMNLSGSVTAAVIGDDRSSVCIVHDGFKAAVIDLNYGEKCASAAADYLNGYGISTVEAVIFPRGYGDKDLTFSEKLTMFGGFTAVVPTGKYYSECPNGAPIYVTYGKTELDTDYMSAEILSDEVVLLHINGTDILLDSGENTEYKSAINPDISVCYGGYNTNAQGINTEYIAYPDGKYKTEVMSFGSGF